MDQAHHHHGTREEESKVDLRESWDVNFWCEELNLRAEELKEIVKKVGPSVHEIRMHLTKHSLTRWTQSY